MGDLIHIGIIPTRHPFFKLLRLPASFDLHNTACFDE
jgi:hypothetical protein